MKEEPRYHASHPFPQEEKTEMAVGRAGPRADRSRRAGPFVSQDGRAGLYDGDGPAARHHHHLQLFGQPDPRDRRGADRQGHLEGQGALRRRGRPRRGGRPDFEGLGRNARLCRLQRHRGGALCGAGRLPPAGQPDCADRGLRYPGGQRGRGRVRHRRHQRGARGRSVSQRPGCDGTRHGHGDRAQRHHRGWGELLSGQAG